MGENILVAKQKGNRLKLKITKRKKNQYSSPEYRKTLNPQDSNDLALLFGDLKLNFNAPIDKAYKIHKNNEEDLGPGFWIFSGKD